MRKLSFIFVLILNLNLFVFLNTAYAINPVRNQNLVGTKDTAIEKIKFPLNKTNWQSLFKHHFSKDFCAQKQWLETCYQTSTESCRSLVYEKLQACTPKDLNSFPVRSPSAARNLGEKVGQCLGTHFQEKFPLKNKEVDLCYLDIF